MERLLIIRPDGQLAFIYNDALRPLLEEGDFAIRRASHVEPTPSGHWQVDLAPVGGPRLPASVRRRDALAAEAAWLEQHLFPACVHNTDRREIQSI